MKLSLSATILLALSSAQIVQSLPCICPDVPGWVNGTFESLLDGPAIHCAYPSGTCVWDWTGTLISFGATCERFVSPNSCPPDETGASGTVIEWTIPFSCGYTDPTQPDSGTWLCYWDALGRPYDYPAIGNPQCDFDVTACLDET